MNGTDTVRLHITLKDHEKGQLIYWKGRGGQEDTTVEDTLTGAHTESATIRIFDAVACASHAVITPLATVGLDGDEWRALEDSGEGVRFFERLIEAGTTILDEEAFFLVGHVDTRTLEMHARHLAFSIGERDELLASPIEAGRMPVALEIPTVYRRTELAKNLLGDSLVLMGNSGDALGARGPFLESDYAHARGLSSTSDNYSVVSVRNPLVELLERAQMTADHQPAERR